MISYQHFLSVPSVLQSQGTNWWEEFSKQIPQKQTEISLVITVSKDLSIVHQKIRNYSKHTSTHTNIRTWTPKS